MQASRESVPLEGPAIAFVGVKVRVAFPCSSLLASCLLPPVSPPPSRSPFPPPATGSPSPIQHEQPLTRGELSSTAWLTADFYNPHQFVFQLKLEFVAGDTGRAGIIIIFGLYPQVRARLRLPASALALNSWLLPREGALLKPMCSGDVVRPEEVTALRLTRLAGPDSDTLWPPPLPPV